ncbi:MAG TPA: Ig-like domain repeat protein, partial [Pyrinomonadaceae bacterium]|nr:Ig-like domain repeat protein [Pyrinomonadaceae bacterium]
TYTPAPNAFGTATITIVLMDNGGTDHGGQDTSAPQSFTITVNPVPDTPSVTNASTTVNAQTTSGLVISRNPADGSEVTNFKITNIAGGTLFKNNGTTQINNNDFISFAEGNAGLKFTPALNSTATGSFQVQASLNNTDGGLGGGLATATISVACGSTVVTNSNDSGAGSLRDTILHACTGATLTFDMSAGHVTNAINLTTAELVIDKSLVIQGPRADALTIERNAASQFRVFNITTAVSATISGLTIANGNGGFQGGGISNSNNALLTLNGVVMSGNTAQFGGGVFNFGSGNVSVLNSTISGNTATTSGGGLYNNGPGPEIMTVSNSTISGNTAGSGGGIFNVQAHLNIVSATIVNNSAPGGTGAGGGIYNNSAAPPAAAAVSDSIIATPAATIGNTIVAGNSAGTANGPDIQGAISSQGNNLVGAKDGSSGLTNGVNNDIVGTIANPVNPLLAVLGNYGGPTLTAPPVPGSPVIDAGSSTLDNSSGLTSDQRGTGFNRIVGASADIGAFESRGFTIAIVSGTPQSTPILSSFASPLVISVTAVGNEPTSGGAITFTAPASGASATVNGGNNVRALIGAGQASVSAIANGLAGSYNVTATTANANSVSFSLTNNKAATTTTVASSLNPSDLNQNVTFTATVSSVAIPTGTVQFKDNGTNLGSPVTLNAGGVAQLTTSSLTTGGHNITAVYSGDANFLTSTGTLSGGQTVLFRPLLKFSQPTFSTNENAGFVAITVIRFGDTSLAATVDYATPDDSAATSVLPCSTANGVGSPRCDFETALGTLRFGPGETSKTFTVLITQDLWLEGNETVPLTLSNPTGGAAFQQPSDANAVLTIIDDDVTTPTTNAIDNTDTFVRQQYHDFLNREADPAGLAFWTDNINKCNDATRRPAGQTAAQCIEIQRINTSAAFFLSIEFQNTGYFVERMYKSAFGDILPPTVPVPIRYTTFLTDTQLVEQGVIVGQGNWQAQLDANKKAFALAFVQRPAFLARYPGLTDPTGFVDSLNANAGMVLNDAQRDALISELSANQSDPVLRADVLFKVAENTVLQQREFNRAFVLMEYFGYLRRNPDAAPEPTLNFNGYNFWLGKLNQFNGDYIGAEMIKGFLGSSEYRRRFGP